jgi:hypothetical protein
MNNSLTELEKMQLEHWSRRRIGVLKKCILLYGGLFGGFMSAIMLHDLYYTEKMPLYVVLGFSLLAFFVSGIMGALMWLFWDWRFSRLQKRRVQAGT